MKTDFKGFKLALNCKGAETKKTEAVSRRCSVKKVFLEISQISPENNCARVYFLVKLRS